MSLLHIRYSPEAKKHFYKLYGLISLLVLLIILPIVLLHVRQTQTVTQYAATTNSVLLVDFAFSPSMLTVNVGDTVTWTNTSTTTPHTVTSDIGLFASGNLNPGQTFSYTFATPGTYAYKCDYHQSM